MVYQIFRYICFTSPVNMVFWVSNMDVTKDKKTLEKIDLKMMHSIELRKLKKMIQEELNFRDDIGKDITKIKEQQKEKL